ncbi:pilus assembly protein [Sphingomonas sp. SUN019]|uniref:TadE/TadG family type IV pilus assembly protein n=1 Tax=Sphingomonas sp. SUN019 TaxID=2937788 RepID=UPI0021640B94|nr:TadE family protein [Sphingomonas sp. SUN019]UVO49142.1 pilus assembly protein [Sphingomonas sp. SUN019]
MRPARFALRIAEDRRGNTVIEFAIVAPVMMALLMGLGDLMHQAYAQSILDGAVQKAARDSAIEGGADNTSTLDDKVKAIVGNIVKNGTWTSTRKSYSSFSLVKPEYFDDKNSDGIRQAGECYDDVNANDRYDTDPGRTGQGGAEDVTLYTMTVSYPHVFPVAKLVGLAGDASISSKTLLKNQPYKSQVVTTIKKVCV